MKKNTYFLLVSVCLFFSFVADAKRASKKGYNSSNIQLRSAFRRVIARDYHTASKSLFLLLKNKKFSAHKNKIRYNLALSLYNMGLYLPAVEQFQILVRKKAKGYVRNSLRKIALVATVLHDDAILDYSISHNSLRYVSSSQKPLLNYYLGEYWMRKRRYKKAIKHFSMVPASHSMFYKSLYNSGLAYAELNQVNRAIRVFNNLESRRTNRDTDNLRVSAIMGRARSYYQGKKWNLSADTYYQVPRSSPFWHDTLLEKSWALLRAGRLRSALGNFQTLHSEYYSKHYQPESLLLRAIVYLYICKYFEMGKVLDLFKSIYYPVYTRVNELTKQRHSFKSHYQSLVLSVGPHKGSRSVDYPMVVSRRILREADFAAQHQYIKGVKKQRDMIYNLSSSWRRSQVGHYTSSLIKKELFKAQQTAGQIAMRHLKGIRNELRDFFNQEKYLRYELLRNKRGFLKKKIAQKTVGKVSIEQFDRSFYIQNGYEYWPFKGGEYWLDELGNYHYVGMESCK